MQLGKLPMRLLEGRLLGDGLSPRQMRVGDGDARTALGLGLGSGECISESRY